MAEIRVAETAAEFDQLFSLRAKVFYGEKILSRGTTTYLCDGYDPCSFTTNFIAVDENSVVGGVRIVLSSPNNHAAHNPYFDFSPYLGHSQAVAASASMLCVDQVHRRSGRHIGSALMRAVTNHALESEVTHLCAGVRPAVQALLRRRGWQPVADQFDHPTEGVPVVPMVLELSRIDDRRRLDPHGSSGESRVCS